MAPNDRFSVSSASSIAAPIAPHQAQNGGTISCDSSSSNVSRSASTTPSLRATAPMKRTGASIVRPFTTLLLKFCATARQSPRRISAGEQPFCCAWIMSDLAKTEQRPAMRAAVPSAPHDLAHLLDRVPHPRRLLIEERPGAGRALAAAVVVGNQRPAARRRRLQAEVARALAADLEDRPNRPGRTRATMCAAALNSFS